jgi:predicted membrane-bound spermidine synthase
VVIIWLASRSAGLPLGPDAGVAESATFIDVLSTLFETVIMVVTCFWLRSGVRRRGAGRKVLALCAGLVALIVMTSTSPSPAEQAPEDCAEHIDHP